MKILRTFTLVSLISSSALADDAGLLRCRTIADANSRLACYDGLVVTGSGSTAKAPAPQAAPAQSAAAQKAPPQAVQPAVQQVSPPTAQFGLEAKIVNKDSLDAIESTIPGAFQGWSGRSTFRLANGQVWQVADDSARAHYIDNPTVRIRRGALGSFYIEIQGTNYSPRVRRVQ